MFSTHGCYLHCLEGKLAVLIQKGSFDSSMFAYTASETFLINLTKGLGFIVPPGFEFTVINTQLKDAVFVKVHHSDAVYQSVFENHRGAAYYIIHKNSKREIVRNPYFKECTTLAKINSTSLLNTMFAEPFNTHAVSKHKGKGR